MFTEDSAQSTGTHGLSFCRTISVWTQQGVLGHSYRCTAMATSLLKANLVKKLKDGLSKDWRDGTSKPSLEEGVP